MSVGFGKTKLVKIFQNYLSGEMNKEFKFERTEERIVGKKVETAQDVKKLWQFCCEGEQGTLGGDVELQHFMRCEVQYCQIVIGMFW